MRRATLTGFLTCLACAPALAHPGHPAPDSGFMAGLLHPLSGLDHLLTMVLTGVWGARLGRRALWSVPAAFLTLMAAGATLALSGWSPPHLETGIAASLVVLGLLVALARKLPVALAMTLAGAFAVLHGAAHGQEVSRDSAFAAYATGFLLSTAALLGLGAFIGVRCREPSAVLPRLIGALGATVGLAIAIF